MKKSGKKVEGARKQVEARPYKLSEATELIKKTHHTKFNETVELAINLGVDPKHSDQVVRGTVVLPHGLGKAVRVLVLASGEKQREATEAGAEFVGGDDMVHRALADLPGGTGGAILTVMLAMFALGFVMDAFEIIFVVVPIVAPALLRMPGVDPVWLGIMMAVNLQTSYLHPPLGATLFYLRGVAPPQITTLHIYVGVIPFVLIQLFMLVVLWFWPGLVSWLPHLLSGR